MDFMVMVGKYTWNSVVCICYLTLNDIMVMLHLDLDKAVSIAFERQGVGLKFKI